MKTYKNAELVAKFVGRHSAQRVQAVDKIAGVVPVDADVGRCLQWQSVVDVLEQDDAGGTHFANEGTVPIANVDGCVVIIRKLVAVILLCIPSIQSRYGAVRKCLTREECVGSTAGIDGRVIVSVLPQAEIGCHYTARHVVDAVDVQGTVLDSCIGRSVNVLRH